MSFVRSTIAARSVSIWPMLPRLPKVATRSGRATTVRATAARDAETVDGAVTAVATVGSVTVDATATHLVVGHLYKAGGSSTYNTFEMWVDPDATNKVGDTNAPGWVYAIDVDSSSL